MTLELSNTTNETCEGKQVTPDKLMLILDQTFNSLKTIITELDLEFKEKEKMSVIYEVQLTNVLNYDKTDLISIYLDFDRSVLKLSNQLEYMIRSNDFHRNNLQSSLDDFVYYTIYFLSKTFKSKTLLKLGV